MTKNQLLERIQALTEPIRPEQNDHYTRLEHLHNIKCVAFDFYGTMFLSGVGDIGIDEEQKMSYQTIFARALRNTGFQLRDDNAGKIGLKHFQEEVERHINRQKAAGNDYPEPNILAVWDEVLHQLVETNIISDTISDDEITQFAIEYEFGVNDIWPIPDLPKLLNKLLDHDLKLGIISNSQFYTPLAFEALIGKSTDTFGFDHDLQKWSYEEGVKKPSIKFYKAFVDALPSKNLNPEEVLYIGNDLFKDIIPAQSLGMRTGLYVGDNRSIRHKMKDLENAEQLPDLIIDDLHEIPACLE